MADPSRDHTGDRRVPPAALEMCFHLGLRLPPPWFLPVEAPACGTVLKVPAEDTNDDTARRFVCDRIQGHDEDRHRQVIDNTEGRTFEWPVGWTG